MALLWSVSVFLLSHGYILKLIICWALPCFLLYFSWKYNLTTTQSVDISIFVDMSAAWHISTPWDHSFWDISTPWDLSFWHISTRWDLSFYWDKSWTREISTCWNVLEWEISTGWNIPEWVISRGWDMPNCWHIYKYGNVHWLEIIDTS